MKFINFSNCVVTSKQKSSFNGRRTVRLTKHDNSFTINKNDIYVYSEAYNKNEILNLNLIGYYVYLHRRLTDNEIFYVGKGINRRCLNATFHNLHWANIVNKHGYIVEIVKSNLNEADAFNLEKELIMKYGRIDMNTGILCNMSDGGEGTSGVKFSPELLQHKSDIMTGSGNHRYGKRFYGESNPNFGNTGANNSLSKAVICLDFDGNIIKEYEYVGEVAKDGFTPSNVSECCSGNRAQHGNRQFVFKSEYDVNKSYIYKRGKTSIRPVVQVSMDNTEFIKLYDCIQDVNKYGFNAKVVWKVCKGLSKSSSNYRWYYFDELDIETQTKIKEIIATKI